MSNDNTMYKYSTVPSFCGFFCVPCFVNTIIFFHRDLGEHGILVEGKFVTTKERSLANSIPYKYVVYKAKKKKYEYEYIYKLDSDQHTNRCLFVKPRLLNEEGKRCNNSQLIRKNMYLRCHLIFDQLKM